MYLCFAIFKVVSLESHDFLQELASPLNPSRTITFAELRVVKKSIPNITAYHSEPLNDSHSSIRSFIAQKVALVVSWMVKSFDNIPDAVLSWNNKVLTLEIE
jgi:hypothetical protein